MNKKYMIALIVVIVACGAVFLFIRNKKENDTKKHMAREYSRRISAAKKSPSAGLRHLGQALNRYREDNGAYPSNLSELYPEYIAVKDFIDDIDWQYSPSEKDFVLQKSVQGPGNKVLTASIRSDLQPAPGASEMLASRQEPESPQIKPRAKPPNKKTKQPMTVASTTISSPIIKPAAPAPIIIRHQNADETLDNPDGSGDEAEPYPTFQISEKRAFIKGLKGRYLIWRTEDGSLGFGNIQYPLTEELIVSDGRKWVQISPRERRLSLADVVSRR